MEVIACVYTPVVCTILCKEEEDEDLDVESTGLSSSDSDSKSDSTLPFQAPLWLTV